MPAYVYILASRSNDALYTGATTDLRRRMEQHRRAPRQAFTAKYKVKRLIYFEPHETLEHALLREKRIKRRRRDWKLELIEKINPQWRDLSGQIPL